MTIESAASRPGAEPTAAKRPIRDELREAMDQATPGDCQWEGEIWYPTTPANVSWPRVFPSL
jgi:hypothetical protein